MGETQMNKSALSWLRDIDGLTGERGVQTLKRAYWEGKRYEIEPNRYGIVTVRNHCYPDPSDHAHEVGINQHGIVHHCSCSAFKYGNGVCKHMVYVAMEIDAGAFDLDELSELGVKEDVMIRAGP